MATGSTVHKCSNPRCGQHHEQPGKTGLCFGCHLDALVPRDYAKREDYHYDVVNGQVNATGRPPTGVPILDIKAHQVISEVLQVTNARLRE